MLTELSVVLLILFYGYLAKYWFEEQIENRLDFKYRYKLKTIDEIEKQKENTDEKVKEE